jgi:2'-5' RNA ligase
VYSLNVPLPSSVTRLAGRLARDLPRAQARPRGEHTLVVKRLGSGDHAAFARLAARAREQLEGTDPFAVRVTGVGQFERAATGPSPVVYLAVESPELRALHRRLCREFDAVDGMEGEDYVPHVTVARGGDPAAARRLTDRPIDAIEWTAEELVCYDSERGQPARRLSLPV